MSFFDKFFGKGSQPVRREVHVRETVDADGNPTTETIAGDAVALSPDGSVDSVVVITDRFHHCGHSAERPTGGQCGEPGCRRVECNECFSNCLTCEKPVCLEHSRSVKKEQRHPRRCMSCHATHRRKRITFSILSPFIEVEEEK